MLLRTKTSLVLAVLIVAILSVAGFGFLRFLENSLRKSIFDGLESLSSASSGSVSRFLDDTLKDAEIIASSFPKEALERKDISAIEARLKRIMEIYPKFENGMFILDMKGNLWADYPSYPETRGKNFGFREYFKTTMEKQKGIIGVPYRSARTGELVLTFTALLRGTSNQIVGLLGCSVQLLHPNALGGIRKTRIGESGYVYIYDTSRLMILHPEDRRVLQRDVAPGMNKLFDAAIEGFEGTGETVNSRGVPMLLSLKRIEGTHWILGAQQPRKEAFAPIKEARNRIILLVFFAAVIAILTGVFAVRRLTEPLVKLRNVTMRLGQSVERITGDSREKELDFQEELKEIRSSDEIGDLASAFGEMYEKLKETFASLKETISTLRESEERYRILAEAAHDMIFILNRDGSIQYVNEFAARQHKLSAKEIIGKREDELFPPQVSERHMSNLQKVFETGQPLYGENLAGFTKEEMWLGTWLVPLFKESKEVGAVLGISRDITERRQMEGALRQSEEKYRSLVANANDAIFIAQDGFVKFPNPSALAMTGFSAEEYATIPFVHLIHPEDREMVDERYSQRLRGEEVPNNYSFRILNKAGNELWVQLNAVPVDWEGRRAVLCFLRDITPQKRLEAQVLQAQKMEAVGTLAGGIAHDFNNLLQTVLGYAEILLSEREKDGPGRQELLAIKHATQRGAELTRQLLTFSRKVQSKLRPINLNKEVIQVEGLLKRTLPKMIEVELQLADDLKVINADPAQVEQMLMNLAVNARDAMPERGRLVIRTQNVVLDETFSRKHLETKPGDYVRLTVSDTGHGMNRETLKHIFEPFYTTKGLGKGTGLGLAMVYGIVRSHDSHIFCESAPGKGTTFDIYFPVIEQGIETETFHQKEEMAGGIETILLVDDEKSILDFGRRVLSNFGYTVLAASAGEGALEIYQNEKEKVDLIILDLIMPGMGGQRCLEELLRISPEAKVIIASGYSIDGHPKTMIEAGARAFVNKPYDIKQILKIIRTVLDER